MKERYLRQVLIPEWGEEAQGKIRSSRILIAGLGGLGSPAAVYLAAAGVGTLVLCDDDFVAPSNLNRQFLYTEADIGRPKTDAAISRLKVLNPEVNLVPFPTRLDENTIDEAAGGCNILLDCLDNLAGRRVLNACSVSRELPLVHAGIDGFTGQVGVFSPSTGPCLFCFLDGRDEGDGPIPAAGCVAGVAGSLQATETLKTIIGMGESRDSRLLFFNLLEGTFLNSDLSGISRCEQCR